MNKARRGGCFVDVSPYHLVLLLFQPHLVSYVGLFQRGMLVYCRSFLAKEGNWYVGECQGSSRQGVGARLTKDGRFQVGQWDKDKPTLHGVVYSDDCKHLEVVAYRDNGESVTQHLAADLSSVAKLAGKQPPVDLSDRTAVVSLVRAIVEDPVGHAPKALMLLHRLRHEAKAVFAQEVRRSSTIMQ